MRTPPKKVLFIDSAPWYGGAQRSLFTIIRELKNYNYLPYLLTADNTSHGLYQNCQKTATKSQLFTSHHWNKSISGLCQYLYDKQKTTPIINQLIQQWQPDIIHANGIRSALLLNKTITNNIPLILHARDIQMPKIIPKILLNKISHIIAISHATAKPWLENGYKNKLTVIYNGFHIEKLKSKISKNRTKTKNNILHVAHMVDWKRHLLFLQAFKIAKQQTPNLTATIIGKVHDKQGKKIVTTIKKFIAKHNLTPSVTLITNCNDALPYIANCNVLLSVANQEPFGRTILEAIICQKPIVATAGGGPEEILTIHNTGIIVEDSANKIAQAILQAYNSIKTNYNINKQFTTKTMLNKISKIYNRITNNE